MANVIMEPLRGAICVTYNDEKSVHGTYRDRLFYANIVRCRLVEDESHVEIRMSNGDILKYCYDVNVNYAQVDTVDGEAPTSNENLLDLIVSAMDLD